MTFPLKDLSSLIGQRGKTTGVIVQVGDGFVRVATRQGGVMARMLDVPAVGDRVLVENGIATKAPVAGRRYPV